MSKHPFLVGITGGIGSGKSLICKIFEQLKVPIYYADDRAKALMLSDHVRAAVIKEFGEQSYNDDGSLNRQFVASNVFNDEERLQLLNSIVHPAVGEDFKQWVELRKENKYLIKEAALIFESGSHKTLDFVIHIFAPPEERIMRVLKRDKFRDRQQIEQIMEKQLSDEERRKLADSEINNDGHHLLIPQVLKLHQQFSSD